MGGAGEEGRERLRATDCKMARTMSPSDAQKLWMFNMGYEVPACHQRSRGGGKSSFSFVLICTTRFRGRGFAQSPSDAQKLWMFNMGYEVVSSLLLSSLELSDTQSP